MSKTSYPYFVPALLWNGRISKLEDKKFKTVEDAENVILDALETYPGYKNSVYCIDRINEWTSTNQILILKFIEKQYNDKSFGGSSIIIRIYDKDGNIIYKQE